MKCDLKKKLLKALQNPTTALVVGALCGLILGMLLIPFSKGICIGSNNTINGCDEDECECSCEKPKGKRKSK